MDPASVFGIVGGAVQIAQIITQTVQGLSTLKGRFENADLTIRLLIGELSTIKSAITQLHELLEYTSDDAPSHPDYRDGLEASLEGCQTIMDVLSEEVEKMTKGLVSDSELTRPLGIRARIRVVWNDETMKDHHQRLHSQVLALQLLLQACQCRSTTDQVNLLRKAENQRIIQKVVNDTATLKSLSMTSAANSRRDSSVTSVRGSTIGETVFDFDDNVVSAAAYRRVMMLNRSRSERRPDPIVEGDAPVRRQISNATTAGGTDEGYASGTAGTRTPDRSLSTYLNSTDSNGSFGTTSFEDLQASENDVTRSRTVSLGGSPLPNNLNSVRRWQSDTTVPLQRSSGSRKEKLLSTLRRLNTSSRSSLTVPNAVIKSTSPTFGSMRRRRSRLSESNISIDFSEEDNVTAPPLIKATQSGAKSQVEILISKGADIEACHAATGRNALAVAAHCGKDDIVDLLLHHNAKVNVRDHSMSTPLHLAASRGHAVALDLLLADGAEVDARDSAGRTAFWTAANAGYVDATVMLLNYNCKVNARADEQMTALHATAMRGDEDIFSVLLRVGIDIEAKDINMKAAIHYACEHGHTGVIALLLKHKANIEALGHRKLTPLICAAAAGKLEATRYLLKQRASCQAKDEDGMSALHWAAYNGHVEVVELLLQKKMSMVSTNAQGRTPLHLGAMNGQFAVVEFLVRQNAPLNLGCRQKFTPLHYACRVSVNNVHIVQLLLASGADVEARTKDTNHRPIHVASYMGSVELSKLLCEKGAQVDSLDISGNRALCIACSRGHINVALHLLDSGAQLRVKAGRSLIEDSPLCLATIAGHVAVVALLLDRGACPTETDEMGLNPLFYAAHYAHPQVLGLLLNRANIHPTHSFFTDFAQQGFSITTNISDDRKQAVRDLLSRVNPGGAYSGTQPAPLHFYPAQPPFRTDESEAHTRQLTTSSPSPHDRSSAFELPLSTPRAPTISRERQHQEHLAQYANNLASTLDARGSTPWIDPWVSEPFVSVPTIMRQRAQLPWPLPVRRQNYTHDDSRRRDQTATESSQGAAATTPPPPTTVSSPVAQQRSESDTTNDVSQRGEQVEEEEGEGVADDDSSDADSINTVFTAVEDQEEYEEHRGARVKVTDGVFELP
ncbi:hypothetical protein AJ80_05812 [Polytolypa hystricis UAMH7299]|uniref:Uncharacterized protein n=1 Tax=Polytolypa hystricis (strain UAMH7299) TaxID=1447883 RepID=A0A2B7Y1T6_POLH7|nr:hypothetical protein AJ80_05812 [Polytolypa hystricis UAMH7299]